MQVIIQNLYDRQLEQGKKERSGRKSHGQASNLNVVAFTSKRVDIKDTGGISLATKLNINI